MNLIETSLKRQLILRNYQEPISDYAMNNDNVVLALCPGGGKTEIAIDIIRRYLLLNPNKKVLVLTHSTNVLLDNFVDRLNSIDVDFTYSTTFDPNANVHITIPQHNNKINKHYGLLIVDEAHQNYFADRIQDIISIIKPNKEVLLTGTPSKFIKDGGYNIYVFPLNELPEQNLPKLQIELVASNYNWEDEEEVNVGFQFTQKETQVTLDNIIVELIKRVRLKIEAEQVNNPNLITKFKHKLLTWSDTYKKLGKTLIVCRRIEQANLINNILLEKGVNSAVSDSRSDIDSSVITKFKNNEYDVLVVIDRARLGYSDDNLYNIIDMSGTLNPDIIYQMYSRVLRGTPDMHKMYLKVTSQKPAVMDITTACVSAALMLSDRQYLSVFDGTNFNGLKMPVVKNTNINPNKRQINDTIIHNVNGENNIIFPSFTFDTIKLFKNILHNLDNPISIYKLTTIGDVRHILGLSKLKKHTKESVLELAKNYTSTKFSRDFSAEYGHAVREKYLDELNNVLFNNVKVYTKEDVLKVAKTFTGKCFQKSFRPEYQHAIRYNYLEELNNVLSIALNKPTKESVLEIAKTYTGTRFQIDHRKYYKHAFKYKYLDELKLVLKTSLNSHLKEKTLNLAKTYTGNCFGNDFPLDYGHATRNKYLDELNKVLFNKMTKEKVLKCAKDYKGTNFNKDHSAYYNYAIRNKFLAELNIALNKN